MGFAAVLAGRHDLDENLPPDLARPMTFRSFPGPTERAYRDWLVTQMLPLVRIVTGVSVPLWLAVPPTSALWLSGTHLRDLFLLAYAINIPLLLLILAITHSRYRRTAPTLAVAMLVGIGLDTMYGFQQIYRTAPGGVACAAIFFTFLAPFMRLPVRSTAFVLTVLIGGGIADLSLGVVRGQTAISEAGPYLTLLVTSVFMTVGASVVGELLLRNRYVDEQVILRQHAQLVESRGLIRRYVPPAVAERIESGQGTAVDTPQRRRVTVLFSDVVDFTDLADRLDPESLTQITHDYLATMAEVVERNGGTLNEFAGDGFMAIFGAPVDLTPEEQARSAVQAAREIHASLESLNQSWFRLGIDEPMQTRTGINTGVLSVGTFGSAGRATYTAIGLQTNIAARIQTHARPGETLLSRSTWHLLEGSVPCEPRGEVRVKGVHFGIKVYAPASVPAQRVGDAAAGGRNLLSPADAARR